MQLKTENSKVAGIERP